MVRSLRASVSPTCFGRGVRVSASTLSYIPLFGSSKLSFGAVRNRRADCRLPNLWRRKRSQRLPYQASLDPLSGGAAGFVGEAAGCSFDHLVGAGEQRLRHQETSALAVFRWI